MRTILNYVHPVFLVSLGAVVPAAILLQGQGGPCPSPLVLLAAPIELGLVVGFILSLVRTIRHVRSRCTKKQETQ
jgi:hypothetical protein